MYHRKFMELANEEAMKNLQHEGGGPFGSVIVKANEVIAKGRNRVLERHDPTAHGEIVAIRQAAEALGTHDLSGCVLYTNAMPCPMCLSAIIWANIDTVYYGNSADDAAAIGFRDEKIYAFIESGLEGSLLTISQHDRELTLPAFTTYEAEQHTLY